VICCGLCSLQPAEYKAVGKMKKCGSQLCDSLLLSEPTDSTSQTHMLPVVSIFEILLSRKFPMAKARLSAALCLFRTGPCFFALCGVPWSESSRVPVSA
jgi:hypothetical protein